MAHGHFLVERGQPSGSVTGQPSAQATKAALLNARRDLDLESLRVNRHLQFWRQRVYSGYLSRTSSDKTRIVNQ